MRNHPPNYVRKLLARVRRRQLALAQAGRVRESNYSARWAARVRRVAEGFEAREHKGNSTCAC